MMKVEQDTKDLIHKFYQIWLKITLFPICLLNFQIAGQYPSIFHTAFSC